MPLSKVLGVVGNEKIVEERTTKANPADIAPPIRHFAEATCPSHG